MQKTQDIGDSDTLASADVMKRLHISRRTLERYVADGVLAALYLPSGHRRYRPEDVDALLSSPVHDAPAGVVSGGASSFATSP
jgi:hypothetical protein